MKNYKSRVCLNCKESYTPTNGRQKVCPKCRKQYRYAYCRKWVLARPERVKAYQKKFRLAHLEELRERDRIASAKWRKENRELSRLRQREYRKNNAEKHRARNSLWRKNNKEKVNFMNRRDYLKRKRVEGTHTLKQWEKLKKECGYMCLRCKRKEPEIKLIQEHIVPIDKKGTDFFNNIQPLCGRCNSIKHTQLTNYLHLWRENQSPK